VDPEKCGGIVQKSRRVREGGGNDNETGVTFIQSGGGSGERAESSRKKKGKIEDWKKKTTNGDEKSHPKRE